MAKAKELQTKLAEVQAELDRTELRAGLSALIEARYAEVDRMLACLALEPKTTPSLNAPAMVRSAKIDRVLTHRVLGPAVFLLVMALVFQSIFSWAEPFMGAIEAGIGWLSEATRTILGEGMFTDLLTEGVVAGVGNVIVFVPQIALLFLFIALLEDTGYMARAAFIVDRLMARVGLNGKAFVPLLSGYACAIPAIMSTRTISGFKDRVVTILMIPFMSCSARLPVYTLVIAAFFAADERVFGPFTRGGLILLGMYLLSTVSALLLGAIYKRTLLKSPTPPLVLELPPYRLPRIGDALRQVWDRTYDFLRDAGTIILAVTIVLWGAAELPAGRPRRARARRDRDRALDRRPGRQGDRARARADRAGLADRHRSDRQLRRPRGPGLDARLGLRDRGRRRGRHAAARELGHGEGRAGQPSLQQGLRARADGVLRLRLPVHVDARGRAPRDSKLALAAVHARQHDCDRLRRGADHLLGRQARRLGLIARAGQTRNRSNGHDPARRSRSAAFRNCCNSRPRSASHTTADRSSGTLHSLAVMTEISKRMPIALLSAALFGLTLGACGPTSDYRIERTCEDYCDRLVDCNDDTDYDDCVEACLDNAGECDSESDLEQALDKLDECTSESCNDVGGCTVDAWVECIL
ncbi:MAG: ferrous iron transporter B [Deltaproteobacteria bacterium]|nr:ferrous iron transporter B [Deltaproteobacteria bacterium]